MSIIGDRDYKAIIKNGNKKATSHPNQKYDKFSPENRGDVTDGNRTCSGID